ncbi:MAG: hypothetical protein CV089_07940 [Nitrospira sp. WS110]|nr:hypothetical protein [Nitrospira sp. WS110]
MLPPDDVHGRIVWIYDERVRRILPRGHGSKVERENLLFKYREASLTTIALLTHDEQKAAEAAFRGLPINPRWSQSAQQIYLRILAVTDGRNIVADADTSSLAIGGTLK